MFCILFYFLKTFLDFLTYSIFIRCTLVTLQPCMESIPVPNHSFGKCCWIWNSPRGAAREAFFDLEFSPLDRQAKFDRCEDAGQNRKKPTVVPRRCCVAVAAGTVTPACEGRCLWALRLRDGRPLSRGRAGCSTGARIGVRRIFRVPEGKPNAHVQTTLALKRQSLPP